MIQHDDFSLNSAFRRVAFTDALEDGPGGAQRRSYPKAGKCARHRWSGASLKLLMTSSKR